VLVELFEVTQGRAWLDHAVDVLRATSGPIKESPVATLESVRALFRLLQHDGSLPDKLGPVNTAADTASPVSILTAPGAVEPGEDGTVRVPIRIEIDEGYHINAIDPGTAATEAGMLPLTVDLSGAPDGTASLELPDGDPYTGGALEDDMGLLVYTGTVEGKLVIDVAGIDLDAEPVVTVTLQACPDPACYAPVAVSLDIGFTSADEG